MITRYGFTGCGAADTTFLTVTLIKVIQEDKYTRRNTDANRKKFVRYKEGAELYSMCQSKFERMAKEANTVYKVDKVVLVNCDIFEDNG